MKVLVTYGSKRGGTAGLAEMLGAELKDLGAMVEVIPASAVEDLDGYDCVLVGGALYSGTWHRDARRFVRRHKADLLDLPVWLFSSGPLDGSAVERQIRPVRQAQAAIDLIGGRGHMTFGGRLSSDAKGFPASAMAKTQSGDWRDPRQIRDWAKEVIAALEELGLRVYPSAAH